MALLAGDDEIAEHRCSGVLQIAGGSQQHETTRSTGEPPQLLEGGGAYRAEQLGPVAAGELGEELGIVPVPAAKLSAGRGVLRPFVDIQGCLLHAPWPQPVDKHPPLTATSPGVLVDPDHLDA